MNSGGEFAALGHFADILDRLGITYAVGGSMASSAYGAVRFTEDADITVEPFEGTAQEFFECVKADYYISKEAMLQALEQRSSFNVIHLESAFKIDVFVRKDSPYEKQLFSRRRALRLGDAMGKSFSVLSPEDIILLKLQWYDSGGRASQRQWDDVLGILKIQANKLDSKHLGKWAGILNVEELLENAISEARGELEK